jgi:hypothetical protein
MVRRLVDGQADAPVLLALLADVGRPLTAVGGVVAGVGLELGVGQRAVAVVPVGFLGVLEALLTDPAMKASGSRFTD